jgi:hypothetical protein
LLGDFEHFQFENLRLRFDTQAITNAHLLRRSHNNACDLSTTVITAAFGLGARFV